MDSLAQSLLWLLWETHPDVDPVPAGSASVLPLAPEQGKTQVAPVGTMPLRNRSLAIAAGAMILSSGLGAPALANGHLWGSTVYANTREGYALNVRWGPGTNSGINRCVLRGTALQVSGVERNGWVQLIDATWVASNLVSGSVAIDPPDKNLTTVVTPGNRCEIRRIDPEVNPGNLATVITPQNFALNIRNGPGFNYQIVGQYINGSRIPVTGRFSNGWAQLTNGNWVDSGHIQYSGPIHGGNQTNPGSTPNADVMELQRLLRQAGFLPSNFIVSGIYDQTTQNAVREFQRVNGLPITGVVDAATWQALYRATAPPTPLPSPSPNPSPDPTNPPPSGTSQRRVVTDGDATSVFDGPGTEFGTIRSVPNGSIVTVTGRTSGNWSELLDGGWIFSLWLEPV
ncbi:peptidoglycan-binding protein [Nodosilinea sp. FACHB-131]|uniref:peptidoglycan-binding protein n=1 Tax=Cyanophyceae TaxID=3028117 RepID=UPI001685A87C|nr:peptidoglycan-binding protein [Nodosilinea sp. FACHB-131]MBD1875785.1 peptidoglycan-binding protein [Nodosilinea sp. FACHB-131]